MPDNIKWWHSSVNSYLLTDNRWNDICLNYDKILKVIQSLDPNKPYGHHGVTVRMLKPS